MNRKDLRAALAREVVRWAQKPYHELKALTAAVHYSSDAPGQGYYQTEIQILENAEAYIHVSVSVDDGRWRVLFPRTTSFIVHSDGRVEK